MARKRARHFGTIWQEGRSFRIAWHMADGDGKQKRFRRTIGIKRGTAAKRLGQIQTALASDKSPDQVMFEVFGDPLPEGKTFKDWADEYMARPSEHERDPEQVQKENWRISKVAKAPWGTLPIDRIRRKQIKAWHQRRAREASPPTANRGLGVASVVFKYAIEFEAIENNPCEGVRRYSEVGRGRECYLTAEESKALIASCSDWFRPFVVIALHTGMRRGEILELQWDQVEFLHTPGRIQARRKDSRTKKKRLVGMNKHARAALMQVRESAGEANATRVDRVFPWTSWKVRKEWDATLSRCQGIPEDKKEKVVFHTLRHTFASLMVQADTPLEEIMKILGHLHFITVQRYAKFKPDVGVAPVKRLEDVLGEPEDGEEGAGAAVGG